MIASSKSPEPLMPVFIDDTMLYYNSFLNETLLFEEDGEWDEKTVEHEKLQLDKLLDEKNWFDRRNLIWCSKSQNFITCLNFLLSIFPILGPSPMLNDSFLFLSRSCWLTLSHLSLSFFSPLVPTRLPQHLQGEWRNVFWWNVQSS